jgi:hypothetical protein
MSGEELKNIRFFGQCEACQPIEEERIISLLGIRFWDLVQDVQIGDDDLVVTAWPENGHGHPIKAFRTPSGIYAFRGLPGLHGLEYPGPNDSEGEQNPKHFVVKAEDDQNRFLPVIFAVEVPTPKKGFLDRKLELDSSSPPSFIRPPGLLFSAPTRLVPPGIGVIRAQLKEYPTKEYPGGRDAAHAVMEVEVKGKRWYGLSDERGSVVILFPYPTPENSSPPQSTVIPLYRRKWKVTIRVYYQPAKLVYVLDEDLRHKGFIDRELPQLQSIFNQSPANIWTGMPGSPTAEPSVSGFSAELTYGKELVLKTGLAESPPQLMSELYIDTK